MKLVVSLCITCFILLACKENSPHIDSNLLVGRWKFDSVLRNGRPSGTLRQGYMIFDQNGQVKSNIFQSGFSQQYQLNGTDLNIIGEDSIRLFIAKLTEDTCILKGRVWLFDMEFTLVRDSDSTSLQLQ